MKISRIEIENFRQFKDLKLNLTYPEGHEKAGQPLDKICIIGQSGTGKTTLLELISNIDLGFRSGSDNRNMNVFDLSEECKNLIAPGKLNIDVRLGDKIYSLSSEDSEEVARNRFNNDDSQNSNNPLFYILKYSNQSTDDFVRLGFGKIFYLITLEKEIQRKNSALKNEKSRVEGMSLNASEIVTSQSIERSWKRFRYLLNMERSILTHQKSSLKDQLEEAQSKYDHQKVEEVSNQIRSLYNILDSEFQKVLSPFLDILNLEIDNNLDRSINSKLLVVKTKSGKILDFDELSSGIRKVLRVVVFFKVRLPRESILLVDEPENSFFPDIQSKLVDLYTSLAKKSQFLFATHSPIIASDFDPWEVIDLEFDSDGYVIRNEHLKDKEKGWHIDNFDYNPKWLTYQGIYRRFFDLDAVSHPDRADKLTEAALLKAESEKLQKEGKIEEARKKFDAYVTLSQQLR
ncbi:MAG: AAA family ATPase [Bacteroidota bacterium]